MPFEIIKGAEIIRPFQPSHTQFIEHPNGFKVELIDAMGSDLDIANAARVSYGKQSAYDKFVFDPCTMLYTPENDNHLCTTSFVFPEDFEWAQYKLKARDLGILNFMMRDRHGSPFEMVVLKFRVYAPIKVIWEWVRHRMASYNIKSTRYVEWEKDYYRPQPEQIRKQVGKPGNYSTEQIVDGTEHQMSVLYEVAMEAAFNFYSNLVEMGMHKELAANILPMGSMTEMIWNVNARSLMNFLSLRNEEHALEEIRICAAMVEQLAETVIPETLALWNKHGRVTP